MTETHDHETGEIKAAGMPKPIAQALSAIMKEAKQLGYDEQNQFSKYKYVSADKFFSAFGPLLGKHGLTILMDEDSVEITGGQNQETGKSTAWLKTRYKFTFVHQDGEVYGPLFRTVIVPATGAQAFGSAQTYLLKQFLRAMFLVPTGEKDEVDQQDGSQPLPQQQGFNQQPGSTRTKTEPGNLTIDGTKGTEFKPQFSQADIEHARSCYTAIRQQIAQSTTVADVDAVLTANTKQLDDIKRIAGEPHWQKLMDSAKARKDMLAPEMEPVP